MKPIAVEASEKVSTGCRTLDAFLHGGIPTSHITEIVSESGSGKTQFCLQLSLNSPSLYIHSEFPFPLSRLTRLSQNSHKIPLPNIPKPISELSQNDFAPIPISETSQIIPLTNSISFSRISQNSSEIPIPNIGHQSIPKPISEISQNIPLTNSISLSTTCQNYSKIPISNIQSQNIPLTISQNESISKVESQNQNECRAEDSKGLDYVFVRPVYSAYELFDLLSNLEKVLQNTPFKLIIIDSIAALFRSDFEYTGSDMKKRASLFFKISGKLKEIAYKFRVAVVVTNQVVDVMENGKNGLRIGNFEQLVSSGREVSPALGLSWANCVNSRIFLSRDEDDKRRFHVVFSPFLPKSTCEYVITGDGVFGVDSNAMVFRKTP